MSSNGSRSISDIDSILILAEEWTGNAPSSALYDDFVETARKAGQPRRAVQTEFGARLKKLVPELQKVRKAPDPLGQRCYVYEFPGLQECRGAFEQRLKMRHEWPDHEPRPGAAPKRSKKIKKRKARTRRRRREG